MTTTVAMPRIEEALSRAAAYTMLAHAFAYPDAEGSAELRLAANELLEMGGAMPLVRLAAIARELDQSSLESVFVTAMTMSSSPDSPSFETAYYGSDALQQTQRMADIAGFYRLFGVDATSGGFRPDDLCVELEFMAFLCRKEAYALEHLGAPRTSQARKAQRLFLTEHLGTWAPVFARKLAAAAPPGHFYRLAAETLGAWVQEECEQMGASPVEVPGDVAQPDPMLISHGPEFAGNASFVPMEELVLR